MSKVLYIGLSGLAGSGKDTVAKMLKTILSKEWNSLEECQQYYKSKYIDPTQSATYNTYSENDNVMCIAYADQLKQLCSDIYGIPIEKFYMNKSQAWVCFNQDFQYTEIKPDDNYIVTAKELSYGIDNYKSYSIKYWMSLREILVYVGTYIMQEYINQDTFVNIVHNKIKEEEYKNPNLKYAIVTDNRFTHEVDFVHSQYGITINIVRDSIQALDNIAEHDFDEEDEELFDYTITNNGSYDQLFKSLWGLVHNHIEFKNEIVELKNRDHIGNFLRLVYDDEEHNYYRLCAPMKIQNVYKSNGSIKLVNPVGGPNIQVGEVIQGTKIIPSSITFHQYFCNYVVAVEK